MTISQIHPPSRSTANATEIVLALPAERPLQSVPWEVLESLRYMVARVTRRQQLPRRLSLLAAERGEGVTYLSRALGLALAGDLRARVCVVELNWLWPAQLPAGVSASGLAGVLTGAVTLDQALLPTTNPDLTILPAGQLPQAEHGFIARGNHLKEIIEVLEQRFDWLILDIPAVGATSDAIPLASLGLAGCLVVRQGQTPIEAARLALDDLDHLPLLGVVMNRARLKTPTRLQKLLAES